MPEPLFQSLDSAAIANFIRKARRFVCYAGPGIQQEPAQALAKLATQGDPPAITVCLDFDERVMRMGFGDISAVETLRQCPDISVRSRAGLRTGLIIVDDEGYIFTPTALYLEPDRRGPDAPNAMRMSRDQATDAMARLSPEGKAMAMARAKTPEERERIRDQVVEVQSSKIANDQFAEVAQRLKEAPPVAFDVARQVRIFEAYLQYVELRLTGVAVQRHKIAIPRHIQNLGSDQSIQFRLNTTFDLVERESAVSSKPIEDDLNQIRKNFTPSLGKDHGRVLLKAQKPLFEQRLAELRAKLEKFQEKIKSDLQRYLDASREEVVKYYVPRIIQSPPDAFSGRLLAGKPAEDDARKWLHLELQKVFPAADDLIEKMELILTYKDVTFETLNRKDFLPLIRAAFPTVNWDKPYSEFRAAGEKAGA